MKENKMKNHLISSMIIKEHQHQHEEEDRQAFCDSSTSSSTSTSTSDTNTKKKKKNIEEFIKLWENNNNTTGSTGKTKLLVNTTAIKEWMECDYHDVSNDIITDPTAYTTIPTHHDYQLLVEAYNYAIDKYNNHQNQHGNNNQDSQKNYYKSTVLEYNSKSFQNGLTVEVRSIPYIGRGVFTLQNISKGTMVWKPSNAAEFPLKDVYKDFFVYLLTKSSVYLKFACDSFLWSYTTRKSKNLKDGYIICLDMDHSSLFNEPDEEYEEDEEDEDNHPNKDRWLLKTVIRLLRDASLYEYDDDEYGDDGYDDDDDDGANIGQKLTAVNDDDHDNYDDDDDDDEEEDEYDEDEDDDDDDDDPRRPRLYYGCQDPPMYALRDIKAGEELKMSYDEFSVPEGWEALGIEYGILNIDTVM